MAMKNTRTVGNFKLKKAVTLPVFKLAAGEQRFFFFDGPMHIGKDTGQVMNGKKMEPATVAEVTDLQTGEQGILICATVLASELRGAYPDDGYVGKGFAITLIKVPEKKYNMYEILEVEPDEAEVERKDDPAAPGAKAANAGAKAGKK